MVNSEPGPEGQPARTIHLYARLAYGSFAAAAAMLLVHLALPELRLLTKFLLPLPFAVVYIVLGPSVTIGIMAAVFGGLLLAVSAESALLFAADDVVLAIVFAEQVRRQFSTTKTILVGTFLLSLFLTIGVQVTTPGLLTGPRRRSSTAHASVCIVDPGALWARGANSFRRGHNYISTKNHRSTN